jgi:hypothetical protein
MMQTFAEWKQRFDAEMALNRAKLAAEGADKRGKGLSGKQFFRQLEADNLQVRAGPSSTAVVVALVRLNCKCVVWGPSGKQFFRQLQDEILQVRSSDCCC